MKRLFRYIQQRLELRLGLLIVLIITVVFSLLFDFLFYRCKQYIQHVAIDRAVQLLDNTVEHINGIMEETELVIRGRHDPCIALRAVPVVEAVAALCVLDLLEEQ